MTTADVSGEKQGQPYGAGSKDSVLDNFSELHDRLRFSLGEDASEESPPIESTKKQDTPMPRIKGLEILKEGGYAVDLEKTIENMFAVIRNMETQLEKVLNINAHLEKDLIDSKKIITELKASKRQLEGKVSQMEEEIPPKRQLQIEIDHLIEDRNSAELSIRELKLKLKKTQDALFQHQKRVGNLVEEKKDAVSEIDFFEKRLAAAVEKIRENESHIKVLEGAKLAQAEKIKVLDEELRDALDEKNRLSQELKETKVAMEKVSSTLAGTKLQAKRSYYTGADEKS